MERFPEATALSKSTCPTNILPATLKVSVGEVPMVSCSSQEIYGGAQNTRPSVRLGRAATRARGGARKHGCTFRMSHCIIPKK